MGALPRAIVSLLVGTAITGCFSKPGGPTGLAGSGSDGGTIVDDAEPDAPPGAATCANWGPWSQPVPLDAINTAYNDFSPSLSGDHSRLVFESADVVYEATWDGSDYGNPLPIYLPAYDSGAVLSGDGQTLYYVSYTHDNGTDADIVYSTRSAGGTYSPIAVPLAGFAEQSVDERNFAVSADGLDAVADTSDEEILISSRMTTNVPFAPPTVLAVASSPDYDCCATVSPDGLQIIWEGHGGGAYGIYETHRADRTDAFSMAALFDGLSSSARHDTDPQFSGDGTRLVFASNVGAATGTDDFDLFMLERACNDP